jgi:hypothetical protein
MSTRFPARIVSSIHDAIYFAATKRNTPKLGVVDAVFLGMIATSIAGLAYIFLH